MPAQDSVMRAQSAIGPGFANAHMLPLHESTWGVRIGRATRAATAGRRMRWLSLKSCRQDHTESRLAAHHPILRLRSYASGARSRGMVSIIGRMSVDRGAGRPPLDCSPIRDQQQRRYFNRFRRRAENDQLSVHGQATNRGTHRVGVGHRRQNYACTAQLADRARHLLRAVVDAVMGAQFSSERLLVCSARDRDRSAPHLRGKLHAKMPQAADAEDRSKITRSDTTIARRVECGDAGT